MDIWIFLQTRKSLRGFSWWTQNRTNFNILVNLRHWTLWWCDADDGDDAPLHHQDFLMTMKRRNVDGGTGIGYDVEEHDYKDKDNDEKENVINDDKIMWHWSKEWPPVRGHVISPQEGEEGDSMIVFPGKANIVLSIMMIVVVHTHACIPMFANHTYFCGHTYDGEWEDA